MHFVGCTVQAWSRITGRECFEFNQFMNCGRGFAGALNFSCVVTLFGGKVLIEGYECLFKLKLS